MKNFLLVFFLFSIAPHSLFSQTLEEKMGYKSTDKLLIIYGDDLGGNG